MLRELHRTIRKVTEDIPRLSYNTAIAAIMKYMNVLRSGERRRTATKSSPWSNWWRRSRRTLRRSCGSGWDTRRACSTAAGRRSTRTWRPTRTVTVAVQVNGKLRGTVVVAPDAAEEDVYAAAAANPR